MTELTPGNIHLWLASDLGTLDPTLAARYAAMLNPEEQARWQRFIYAHDRQRFLLTRALVRTVLAQYLDVADPASLAFITNAHGKPALAGASNINFNLSHTKGLVALAVTSAHQIGVDVEAVNRRVEMLELAARYFSASENQQLLELSGAEQRERFFRLWTLKEAYVKARGLGLRIPLDSFSFSFAQELPAIAFAGADTGEHQQWFFHCMQHAGDFRIALALRSREQREIKVQTYTGVSTSFFR